MAHTSFFFLIFLLTNYLFYSSPTTSASFPTNHCPPCHDHEKSALLQFKESLNWSTACRSPKVEGWGLLDGGEARDDCCSWDGIECDDTTGHVISLDLSSSCLSGSINSSSSLFQLLHLRYLNLANNDFHHSIIPSALGHLPNLTHLDLSYSWFSGPIPSSISNLSKLSSLDLSSHYFGDALQLRNFKTLITKLANLQVLHLDGVDISSTMPDDDILANSSSLVSLSLENCNLHGHIPSSLQNHTQLVSLGLGSNHFVVQDTSSLSWMGNLAKLTYLSLGDSNLTGGIPSSFSNLTKLSVLNLESNQLTGPLPAWLGNLTQLTEFDASDNEIQGVVPRSLSQLKNLEILILSHNKFDGPVELEMFFEMQTLYQLELSGIFLSLNPKTNLNTSFPKFSSLSLESCNLSATLSELLRGQDDLGDLFLRNNSIHGQIPPSICNLTTLTILDLGSNDLSGTLPSCLGNLSASLLNLDISENNLGGTLPDSFSPAFETTRSMMFCPLG